jgi:hypothetical protein
VRESPLDEATIPENPIRRFVVSPSIYPVITAVLKDTEVEELPTDYDRGLDFSITKTTKGQYADYSTSKWARKESALTASERAAIDAYGLFNLKDFLPKKPSDSEIKIIKEMFEASVDGQVYDADRWSQYYKPAGLTGTSSINDDIDDVPVAKVTSVNPQITDSVTVTEAPKATNPRAEEILSMIRNRKTS